ncbi:MAG: GNAT family N-acetyltransferase [Planctomycetes bacterium]|nr:GNAT family N-acetyltransferase [Planctomycetota bacterium]
MLETDRLILREFTPDDAEAFLTLCSDPAITRFVGGPQMKTLDQARAGLLERPIADYRKHGYGRWACVFKSTNQVIGFAGLKYLDELKEVDIGYRFLPAYWGMGLATEASRPVIDFGFTHVKLPRILGLVDQENTASIRVLEKLGLHFVEVIDYFHGKVAKYVIDAPR